MGGGEAEPFFTILASFVGSSFRSGVLGEAMNRMVCIWGGSRPRGMPVINNTEAKNIQKCHDPGKVPRHPTSSLKPPQHVSTAAVLAPSPASENRNPHSPLVTGDISSYTLGVAGPSLSERFDPGRR